MGSRLLGMIVKEFLHLMRDPMAVVAALFLPVLMLFIFGWAVNTDVKHIATAVLDQSRSTASQKLLEAFENSRYFNLHYRVDSPAQMTRLIDEGKAKVGIVIPPDYARQLTRQRARIQVLVDASDPLVATSAINSATSLGLQRSIQVLSRDLQGTALQRIEDEPPVDFRVRAWYNPELLSAIFIVPGLIGALLLQSTIAMMAITVVKEREKGTLEALIVSPVRRWELMLGKIIPNLVVAYGQMTMALLVAHYVFDMPVRGSLTLLYVLSLVFMWGTLGIGIYVSTVSRTVAQAMQLSMLTLLPSIYLSGLLFPIEGMPRGAQYLAALIPLTYYLRIVRGILLKGVGVAALWPNILPLVAFGAVIFTLSVLKFRKSLD